MAKRKCGNCGATLKAGTHFCEFCGTDWAPPAKKTSYGPGSNYDDLYKKNLKEGKRLFQPTPTLKPVEFHKVVIATFLFLFCAPVAIIYIWSGTSWNKKIKLWITALFLTPVVLIGIFGFFYETIYAVRMDAPKYSTNSLKYSARPTQNISPEEIYKEMRASTEKSISLRKSQWMEKFQGRWVEWEGEVLSIQADNSQTNQVTIKTQLDQPFEIQIYFDPLSYPRLNQVLAGDTVIISGQLWGYYFLSDMIRISEGHLVKHIKVQKTTSP